ncbi:MAG: hypothetical protein AAF901_10155 [Bacteroidota bacterium]
MHYWIKWLLCSILLFAVFTEISSGSIWGKIGRTLFGKGGAFGWVYQPQGGLDRETHKALNKALTEVERFRVTLDGLPESLQMAMLPMIEKAGKELETTFSNGINLASERLIAIVDETFDKLNASISHASQEAKGVIDYAVAGGQTLGNQAKSIGEDLINGADEKAGELLKDFESIGQGIITSADAKAEQRMKQAHQMMLGVLRAANKDVQVILRDMDGQVQEVLSEMGVLMHEFRDSTFKDASKIVQQSDEALKNNVKLFFSELRPVVFRLERLEEKASEDLRNAIKTGVLEVDALLEKGNQLLDERIDHFGDTVGKSLDEVDSLVSNTLIKLTVFLSVGILLLLTYKVASLAIGGVLHPLSNIQFSVSIFVAAVCLGVVMWQRPLHDIFGKKEPTKLIEKSQIQDSSEDSILEEAYK